MLMLPRDGDVSLEGANQGGGEGVGEQSLESQQKAKEADKSREKENSDNEKDNDLCNVTEDDEEDESIDEDLIEVEEMQLFLKTFDIQAHTDEIARLLSTTTNEEGHDDTDASTSSNLTPLQEHFQTLVPETVSYTDFWSRYFYRCNPERIAREWNRQDQIEQLRQIKHQKQRERALREVSDEALSLARSAASFLKEGIAGAVAGVEELKMHQSKGRPLFVMDATEEDGDSYYEEDEEEEEEDIDLEREDEDEGEEEVDLGWGSEEEDDEGDEASEEDEEVNFLEVSLDEEKGQASIVPLKRTPLKLESLDVVRLRQNLMHTETERNHFLQMVDERNEEICKLRSALEQHQQCLQSAACVNNQAGPGEVTELRREVEWLKQLVAARSNDSQHRDEAISEMKSIINQRRYEIAKNNRRPNKESSISESTKACKAKIQDLQSEIQALKISSCNNEQSKQASLQQEFDQLKVKYNNLKLETQATNECIEQRQTQLKTLYKQQRALSDEHAAFLASPASTPSSSMSSGVKVSPDEDGWVEE